MTQPSQPAPSAEAARDLADAIERAEGHVYWQLAGERTRLIVTALRAYGGEGQETMKSYVEWRKKEYPELGQWAPFHASATREQLEQAITDISACCVKHGKGDLEPIIDFINRLESDRGGTAFGWQYATSPPEEGAEGLKMLEHLGNAVYFCADIHPDDRNEALDNALAYYNSKMPGRKVEPSGHGYQRLVDPAMAGPFEIDPEVRRRDALIREDGDDQPSDETGQGESYLGIRT